jgi:hypothetical protein
MKRYLFMLVVLAAVIAAPRAYAGSAGAAVASLRLSLALPDSFST